MHSDFTVEVEHVLTEKTEIVHISRVKPYMDDDVGNTVQLQEVAEFSDRIWHSADCVKYLRHRYGVYEVPVSWNGLTSSGDTRGPLSVMYDDVPPKARAPFDKKRDSDLVRRSKDSISF